MDLLPFFFLCENHRFSHKFKQISNNTGGMDQNSRPGDDKFWSCEFPDYPSLGGSCSWCLNHIKFFIFLAPCWTMLDSLKHRNFHGPEKWRNWSPPENCRKRMEFPWSVRAAGLWCVCSWWMVIPAPFLAKFWPCVRPPRTLAWRIAANWK